MTRRSTRSPFLSFFIISVAIASFSAYLQQSNAASAEDPQYIRAQITTQRTQAALNDVQFKLAQERLHKSTWLKLIEDDGIGFGAIITGFIAITSLLSTITTSQQMVWQTQIYEALNRLADKDSPALRSAAASSLGMLATNMPRLFWQLTRSHRQRSVIQLTIDQLVASLSLEWNIVTIISIRDTLRRLTANASQSDALYCRDALGRYSRVRDLASSIGTWKAAFGSELDLQALIGWQKDKLTRFVEQYADLVEEAAKVYGLLDSDSRTDRRKGAASRVKSCAARVTAFEQLEQHIASRFR